jgi:hypothetical protein
MISKSYVIVIIWIKTTVLTTCQTSCQFI